MSGMHKQQEVIIDAVLPDLAMGTESSVPLLERGAEPERKRLESWENRDESRDARKI
jgi:hypothetical protein